MVKKVDEKTGKKWFECDTCKKKLKRNQIACIQCGVIDAEAHKEAKELDDMKPKDRMKRVTKEFTEEFDKSILGLALHILESRKSALITELIQIFIEEGLFQGMSVVYFDEKLEENKFQPWAVSYVIRLAKAWHKNKEVFIGTRQIKGHPYEIYLPENAEKLVEDLKVKTGVTSDLGNIMMPFGKYKGSTIQTICDMERGYIIWLYEKATLRDGILKDSVTSFYNKIMGENLSK